MKIKLSELRHIVKSIIKEESSQESKRKLTNVIKQVVREQMTGYAGGTYTLGKGADDAFKNAGKDGASRLPDDVFNTLKPCFQKLAVDNVNTFISKYPNIYKLVLKMAVTLELPNMLEAGLALDEVMSKGIDITALMGAFKCALEKIQ